MLSLLHDPESSVQCPLGASFCRRRATSKFASTTNFHRLDQWLRLSRRRENCAWRVDERFSQLKPQSDHSVKLAYHQVPKDSRRN
uniref:Uncharacterized protein n=1 Tax=Rhizophora mucronata TaxID=61149 RepID=A0A2P2QPE7_RHIMU